MTPRILTVAAADSGQTVAALLRRRLRLSAPQVRELLRAGGVRVNGAVCRDPGRRLRPGQQVRVQTSPVRRANPAADATPGSAPLLRFVDEHVVVVDKPAGLTTMRHAREAAEFGVRGRRFLPPTLADLLPGLLGREGKRAPVRAVHRLDKETSGLVVFARTAAAERHLDEQFRAHTVTRSYLAVVRGHPRDARIESFLVDDRGDGRRGSTTNAGAGKRAVTHVRVVEQLGDFALVECRLETGRTHQVRIHLGESGTPLCGERVYDRPPHGKPLPDASGAKRPMLHAASLGFAHPATRKHVSWSTPLPEDMRKLLERLRRAQ